MKFCLEERIAAMNNDVLPNNGLSLTGTIKPFG